MNERDIFHAALEFGDPAQRSLYLEQACAGDPALKQHIEGMLAMHGKLGSFLEAPSQVLGAAAAACLTESPGTVIGRYKLLQQIGEGGMGTVYMAEQTEPVQRKVALKIIKPGMDSRQIIARFEAERQALALMDHPNIARVLDGGTTEEGARGEGRGTSEQGDLAPRPSPLVAHPSSLAPRPYFVMELVKGVPITAYCDAHHLTPRARLRLCLTVCQAVQHAHQKGIIHRDLKPSNVLVAEYDHTPVVKVIDFGVAKAVGPKLTERTLFTEYGQIIGTVEYMSPEQAKLNALDIDTRSDIYALGVLLYELLTGTTPLEQARLRQAPFDEALRLVREEEPPTPSNRLSTLAELPAVATNRGVEPRELSGLVRGELDWIVMKCLEKERDRRYESASALAADIERYLNDEPVAAGPLSRTYRLRKFVRRHRGAVLAASSIALLLVLGIIGTTTGLAFADRARHDALDAQQKEETQRRLAETRDAETQAVFEFVQKHVLGVARPKSRGGLGVDVTVERAIEEALPVIAMSFPDQPLIEARLHMTMGYAFYNLGKGKRAAEQFAAARAIYTVQQGPDGTGTYNSVMGLADSYELLSSHRESLALRQELLTRRTAVMGRDHPDTLRAMMSVANSLRHLGQSEESVALQRETLALRKAKLGERDPETLRSMNNLASSLYDAGHHKEALRLREQTLELRRAVLGEKHTDTLLSMMALANSYYRFGRLADAARLYEETVREQQAQLGRDHPATLSTTSNLANCYGDMGDQKVAAALRQRQYLDVLVGAAIGHAERMKALRMRQETLEQQQRKLGPDHDQTLASRMNLAVSLDSVGRHKEAIELQEETLTLQRTKLGLDHPDTLMTMGNLADSYDRDGRYQEALQRHREAFALREAKLGANHPDTLGSMWGEAVSLIHLKRTTEAVQIVDKCLDRANGKVLEPGRALQMIDWRLRHFARRKDGPCCRASAEMWEKLDQRDAASLYTAACFRAVTAEAFGETDAKQADAEADRAIAWLREAVAAGYYDAASMASDRSLAVLRDRADFKELLASLKK
jgi:eukaryotic-like serine/threonine-protein kinase